jgi:invasion protein IalB
MNTLRQIGWSNLLALVFAFGTSLAVAQEGQTVPKTTVAKAAPAAPAASAAAAPAGAPAAGAEADQGKGSAWVKLCSKNEQTGNKQLCLVKYVGLDPNTGMSQITVAVRSVEGEDKQILLFGVTTAYTLVIPIGVQIKIDDNQPIPLKYAVCLPASCQAQTELTKEIFDKMRKGKQVIVAAMNVQQKPMGFQVPLIGFGKAYDGPPADNAKYEEAQRQMMETIRQRQIDLANKVADQKKVQGGNSPSRSAAGWHAGPGSATAAVNCFHTNCARDGRSFRFSRE